MLNLGRVDRLAAILEVPLRQLKANLADREQYFDELLLIDPAKPHKRRTVLDVRRPFRTYQERLHKKLLLPRLEASPHSHGGVRGRSVKTNALPHVGSRWILKADISNFYPSISHRRVYNLFTKTLGCSPDVARICTQLCTYDYHLALGLVTSPILADQMLQTADRRIAAACKKADVVYTRYVDDITLSADFPIHDSGFPASIASILKEHGFTANDDKWESGAADEGVTVTGVEVRRRSLRVPRDYLDDVERQVEEAEKLSVGVEIEGPYATKAMLKGRIGFACWINSNDGSDLRKRIEAIDWAAAMDNAQRLGLVIAKKKLVRKH